MVELFLAALAGFLCTSVLTVVSDSLRDRQYLPNSRWILASLQLVAGVLILTELFDAGFTNLLDLSDEEFSLRVTLGILSGVILGIAAPKLHAALAHLPERPDGHLPYAGPIMLALIVLAVGAVAPYFDRFLANLKSFETPFGGATFAEEASSTLSNRLYIEEEAAPDRSVTLRQLVALAAVVQRDRKIATATVADSQELAYPSSQQAAFKGTWASVDQFFQQHLLPLAKCTEAFLAASKNLAQTRSSYESLPTYLEAVAALHRTSRSPSDEIAIKDAPDHFDRLWAQFEVDLERSLAGLDERLLQIDPGSHVCRAGIKTEGLSWDAFLKLAENPYFAIALSVMHESVGNKQRALEVLLERGRELPPGQSDPLVNRDFIEKAPNFVLRLLQLKQAGGGHFLGYKSTLEDLIASIESLLTRMQDGEALQVARPICDSRVDPYTGIHPLPMYGANTVLSVTYKNLYVYETVRMWNQRFYVSQNQAFRTDKFLSELEEFLQKADAERCALEPVLRESEYDIKLYMAHIMDTVAMYHITKKVTQGKEFNEDVEFLEEALDMVADSSAESNKRAQARRIIEHHIRQAEDLL